MAVLLREAGIPTRYVQGFRAGDLDPLTGVVTYKNSDAHAWVQVYFPGYGWIDFDPTGGDSRAPGAVALRTAGRLAVRAGPSSSASRARSCRHRRADIENRGGPVDGIRPECTMPGPRSSPWRAWSPW